MRLMNGDPEQQRNKEAAKENYKRQLALQMQLNLKRKEEEKQREKELEEKYQRAFYEQQRQLQQQQDGQSSAVSPATRNINNAPQHASNNRSVSEKHIGSPEHKPSIKEREAQRQAEYIDGLLGRKDSLIDQLVPSLLMKRQRIDQVQQQSPLQAPNMKQMAALSLLMVDAGYEEERLHSIQQFQESILRKVDELKGDIGRAASKTLETTREVDRIRGLLRQRNVLHFDSLSLQDSKVRDRFRSDDKLSYLPQQPRKPARVVTYSASLRESNISSSGYRQLDSTTEVRYPDRQDKSALPVAVPSSFARIPPIKTQSSEAEDEEYDKVEVPELPNRLAKQASPQGLSKFAPERSNKGLRDVSFDRAKFVPKSEIIDYKIESMLNNIDNLIEHYDRD